jgi:hypothetical protein
MKNPSGDGGILSDEVVSTANLLLSPVLEAHSVEAAVDIDGFAGDGARRLRIDRLCGGAGKITVTL